MNVLTPTETEEFVKCFAYFRDVNLDNEYYKNLKDELEQYKKFIKNLIDVKLKYDIYSEISSNCEKILNSVNYYYNGQLNEAIECISNIINSKYLNTNRYLKSSLDESLAGVRLTDFIKKYSKNEKHKKWNRLFFKARVLDTPFTFLDIDKIFHIPFHRRDLIANQRYSINGLPCLYLGSTAVVCWEELNRPNFEYFYMSNFVVKDSDKISILDLSYGYFDIINILKDISTADFWCFDAEKMLKEMLVIWPLVAASRYTVKAKNRTFKSEYIIPQLIMQAILKLKIDGVAYISTKIPRNIFEIYKEDFGPKILYTNYAFPAIKDTDDEFFSNKLRRHFKIKEVFNLGSFQYINTMDRHSHIKIKYDVRSPINLFDIQGYGNSIFNKFEEKICSYPEFFVEDKYSD